MKKMTRNALLLGLGVCGAVAYQKYKKPAKRQIDKMINKMRNNDNKLDEMM